MFVLRSSNVGGRKALFSRYFSRERDKISSRKDRVEKASNAGQRAKGQISGPSIDY